MSEDAGDPTPADGWPPPLMGAATPGPAAALPAAPEAAAAVVPRKRSLLRRIFRPWVVVSLVAAAVIAGNVWMYLLVDGWRAEDRDLREAAHVVADSVGEKDALIETQDAMLALLASQAEAAKDWATELDGQIAAKKEVSDGYKNAALAFERCGDKRAEAIAALWSGGSGSAQIAEANAECDAAQAQLGALEGGS